ncbi:hypothetical protein CDD82_3268 [Ophiocordyceps australis]|uniref:DNA-directed DNA polymerase n=1 Tax=Ophiocordyceps australis TaxID=1399860 RepID=A0A2C5ZFP6_9HYPO|nr:hypothetical protein CDD82_3268 [Ophiocordyceps australis]
MAQLRQLAQSLLEDSGSGLTQQPLSRESSCYKPLHTFALDKDRPYQQQYGDMYFLRLAKLKPVVDEVAAAAWEGTLIGDEEAKKVDRVLDVRQGDLCWVVGTVYMEMALKPNVLEDVINDRWITAPLPTQRYYNDDELDQIMLEDDSGRLRLVGQILRRVPMVTGCIIAVLGTENSAGEFEVLDLKLPEMAPQPQRWALTNPGLPEAKAKAKADDDEDEDMTDDSQKPGNKIAIVSGLNFAANDASHALELNLLLEFLLGEALERPMQDEVARISRLIIAGNSISTVSDERAEKRAPEKKVHKKYGYDASTFNPLPSKLFDEFMTELLPSMPITLLPGSQDPANAIYPQQPIHMAMFYDARQYGADDDANPASVPGWFNPVTNPFEAEIDGWRILGTGGQNIDDVFKYIDSDDRLGMMDAMCRWRCCAPTAPDTLWSYPFQEDEPFVMQACPHVYFVGCQPEFSTRRIYGSQGQTVRLITVPSFSETKEIVLLDTETLEATRLKIEVDVPRPEESEMQE